eukprot:GEMP01017635.1.p1 GENE.GEMP01017635.1~~GEMP01017635.1.p1  ORF type:complete len:738 (+),score=245.03 GEMP01017635.1:289-2502(+)
MDSQGMDLNLSALLHVAYSEDPVSSRSGIASVAETSESGLTEINQVLDNINLKPARVNNDQLRMRPDSWNIAELHSQRQRLAMQNALAQEKQRHESEMREIKAEFERRYQRILKATEEMQTMKEQLRDLSLSDARYVECKRLPDEELSVREFVLIRVYELRQGFKDQIEQLQLTRDSLTAESDEAKHQQARLTINAEHKSSALSGIQEDFHLLKDESERRIAHLTLEAKKREQEAAELTGKAEKYDDVNAEVERLRAVVDNLQALTKDQSAQIMQLTKEKIDLAERASYLDTRKAILEKETANQLVQLQQAEGFIAKRGKENENLEQKLSRIKEKKRALQMKIELEQANAACEVRERINVEIQRLETQMQRDIELQKEGLIKVHQKEAQMLSQQVLELERQRAELQRRVEESGNSKDDLKLAGHKVQMELQNEITELRGLLKLRGFENDRFSISYEETNQTLQKTTWEKEELRAKVDLLRKEYYELEVRLKEDGAQDRATKLALQEQLASYQQMERELDLALEDVANHEDVDAPAPQSVTDALIVGTTLAGAPACTRRRIQESLILAQQLQRRTRDVAVAQRNIQDLEERVRVLEEEKLLLEKEKQWKNEPTHYLTESLRVREQELADLRRAHTVLKREFESAQEQSRNLRSAHSEVERDLRTLLLQREQVNALQSLHPRSENDPAARIVAQTAHAVMSKTARPLTSTTVTAKAKKPLHKDGPQWAQKLSRIRVHDA